VYFQEGEKKQICQEETFVWLLAVRVGMKLAYKVMHISLLYWKSKKYILGIYKENFGLI